MELLKNCKIGIIGCGRIAGHHLRSIQSVDRLQVSAVCDMESEKAENYGEIFKASHFTNYDKMLNEIDISPIKRPENLTLEEFCKLEQRLFGQNTNFC